MSFSFVSDKLFIYHLFEFDMKPRNGASLLLFDSIDYFICVVWYVMWKHYMCQLFYRPIWIWFETSNCKRQINFILYFELEVISVFVLVFSVHFFPIWIWSDIFCWVHACFLDSKFCFILWSDLLSFFFGINSFYPGLRFWSFSFEGKHVSVIKICCRDCKFYTT